LPKSVTPSRVEENFHGKSDGYVHLFDLLIHTYINHTVTALPQDLFDKLEQAATSHPPQRVVNPSKGWGLGYDVFEWGN
jgi:hypothetical protein